MEFKLHYLPEKPECTCEVLVFHRSKTTGHIFNIANVSYSSKFGVFNAYDHFTEEDADGCAEYSEDIAAWAYFDEVDEEALRCISERI